MDYKKVFGSKRYNKISSIICIISGLSIYTINQHITHIFWLDILVVMNLILGVFGLITSILPEDHDDDGGHRIRLTPYPL